MTESMRTTSNGDVQDLLGAWVAIQQLLSDFAYSVDMRDGADTAELFTEDGWYESDSGRSQGRDAIRRAYSARAARGPRTARHIFTNLRVEHISGNLYSGTSLMLLFAEDGLPPKPAKPLLVSDVTDTYIVEGSTALLRTRTLRDIFVDPENKAVLPLGAADHADSNGTANQEPPIA